MLCKKIEAFYDLDDPEIREKFTIAKEAWTSLDNCDKINRVLSNTPIANYKYHAGANQTMDLGRIKILKKYPRMIKSNLVGPTLDIGGTKFCIMPDSVLAIRGNDVRKVTYSHVIVNLSYLSFRESERVPKDAQEIGCTWKYINKDGTQDLRFKNNKKIPICRYCELLIRIGNYQDFTLVVSNIDVAISFKNAVDSLRDYYLHQ